MFMGKYKQKLREEITEYQEKIKKMLQNTIHNLVEINIFSNVKEVQEKFEKRLQQITVKRV